MPSDSGWLIEKGQLCLGVECHKPAWVTFTSGFEIRFAREQDALAMLEGLQSFGDGFGGCTISKHEWVGPSPLKTMVEDLREADAER